MTPEFAEAIDPIIQHVVELLDQIEANESPDSGEERVRIRGRLDRAEAKFGQQQDWLLAKYALVAWIDELLIEAPRSGREWWENNALEFDIFNTRDRYIEFYNKAKEASTLRDKSALEVFYVCVVLGFRGLYRDPSSAIMAEQDMPPTLEAWAKNTSVSIHLGQGVSAIAEAPRPGIGAPPLEGKFLFLGTLLGAVVLAAINAVLLYTILA